MTLRINDVAPDFTAETRARSTFMNGWAMVGPFRSLAPRTPPVCTSDRVNLNRGGRCPPWTLPESPVPPALDIVSDC